MFLKKKQKVAKDLLIILDIDGVLNKCTSSYRRPFTLGYDNLKALESLCIEVRRLGFKPKAVLSSTWKNGYNSDISKCSSQIRFLIESLDEFNLEIIGITPMTNGKSRDEEISRYLSKYSLENSDFEHIVLDDDMSIFKENSLNVYEVNYETGLVEEDVQKIIKQCL